MTKNELLNVATAIMAKMISLSGSCAIVVESVDTEDCGGPENGPDVQPGYRQIRLTVPADLTYWVDLPNYKHSDLNGYADIQGCDMPPLKDWILGMFSSLLGDAEVTFDEPDDDHYVEFEFTWPDTY